MTTSSDTASVAAYLARCGCSDIRPPASPGPVVVAEALALSLPDPVTPEILSSLYTYRVPSLSPDGMCSLPNDLDPVPFSLAEQLLSLPLASPQLASHPLTLRLHRLHHVVSALQSVTGCDWLGVYELTSSPGSRSPALVKLAYLGESSRAVFPVTPEFLTISSNSRTAATGLAGIIPDVRQRTEGVAYYECSGKVLSECCLPILNADGNVVGIIDAESWKAEWASGNDVVWQIGRVCQQLGLTGLIGRRDDRQLNGRETCRSADSAKLHILVVTPIATIVEEFMRRPLPEGVTAEIADDKAGARLQAQIASADIIFGEPIAIRHRMHLAKRLRWVQLVMAGIDKALAYIDDLSAVPYRITRAGGDCFGSLMAEYIVGMMLAHERQFHAWSLAQRDRRWRAADPSYTYRRLHGLTVGIMGCSGQIGQHIARFCRFFGMNIKGLASAPRSDKQQHDSADGDVSWYHTEPSASPGSAARVPAEFLHDLDYLVNVLPSTAATRFILGGDDGDSGDSDVLRHCRRREIKFPRTVFINIGRGDVISEARLLRALLGSNYRQLLQSAPSSLPVPGNDAFLAGAVLDVFITEPLPSSHAFYSLSPPLLTVTPHVSGVSAAGKDEIVGLFMNNLQRFMRHEPLLYEVDAAKGY